MLLSFPPARALAGDIRYRASLSNSLHREGLNHGVSREGRCYFAEIFESVLTTISRAYVAISRRVAVISGFRPLPAPFSTFKKKSSKTVFLPYR